MRAHALPPQIAKSLDAIVDTYHRFTPSEDVHQLDAIHLKSAVISHLELALKRSADEIKIHVFTPTVETHGWNSRHSTVHVVMSDMPFIVDSLSNLISRKFRGAHHVIHPIMHVERNANGDIQSVHSEPTASSHAESWCEFEVNRLLGVAAHENLEHEIRDVLNDVAAVNHDWQRMRALAVEVAQSWSSSQDQQRQESSEFLTWLTENHFTFLGYRHYKVDRDAARLESDAKSGLGLFRDRASSHISLADLPRGEAELAPNSPPLILTKSAAHATVHRSVYMDYIGVKEFGDAGEVIGEHRFLGLFSREAYSDSVLTIPVVRKTAMKVLEDSAYVVGSHSYKNVLQFLEQFPRDEMMHVDAAWLGATAQQVLAHESRRTAQSFMAVDPWGRFVSVVIYLPRDVYNTQVRRRIEKLLSELLQSNEIESSAQLSDSALARVHVRVKVSKRFVHNDATWQSLQRGIEEATRSWNDDFVDLVIAQSDSDEQASAIVETWSSAFNDEYIAAYRVDEAIADVVTITKSPARSVRVVPALDADALHYVRIFNSPSALKLSAMLPLFTAFGLDVSDEYPYQLTPVGMDSVWLHDLGFSCPLLLDADWIARFESALLAALDGDCEVDSLLQLVLSAGLTHSEVAILRTVVGYVSQWGTISISSIVEALITNPVIAHHQVMLFKQLLEPEVSDRNVDALVSRIGEELDAVRSLDADTALRALTSTIQAIMRTNAFQGDLSGRALAIKVAPQLIEQMPLPKPYAEIWMESPRIRGVHLRFGAVARGGLRWSDRRDDMRTEILGLVRAQVVKNAVIVPTGAKGGFFPKSLPDSSQRDAWLAAGIAAYKEFINALLDVTDNRVGLDIVHPEHTVCRDGDDAYLVVAADKGTATFSDTANGIAVERGFWLGDAFASGGSNGYDHKAMGITARGAWESVKHHAAIGNQDPNSNALTVVGVGDMSGDVFGNGMLLSKTIKLIAAFDHRHIFLDPNPNAAATWVERQRLFNLPRSSWADFDASVISEGGGVFARTEKRIELSSEIQNVLGIEASHLTPNELISAILCAPVDLLWNGGIGTYVKAASETHVQVGDKANDAIRIDAGQLRARIVGEGGNLGFTQRGRVEAAMNGVQINTDAIDNSAGVDTSDHEVNLKILLSLRQSADFTVDKRNALLRSLTDDVALHVLADNEIQNQVLTIAQAQAASMVNVHEAVIAQWESEGRLKRSLEALPSTAQLNERALKGEGLTRPELSVLLAHAKIWLTEEILASAVIDEEWREKYLFSYFPQALHKDFAHEISSHPLRREIAATVLANRMVNHGGITMVLRAINETSASVDAIVKAFVISEACGDIDGHVDEISSLGLSNVQQQVLLQKEIRRYFDRSIRWLVTNVGDELDVARDSEKYGHASRVVRSELSNNLIGHERERWQQQSLSYQAAGISQELSDKTAGLLDSFASFDLAELAATTNISVHDLSWTYFTISDELGGDMLLSRISGLPRDDRWQTMARAALRSDMYSVLAEVTRSVLMTGSGDVRAKVSQWRTRYESGIARVKSLLADVQNRDELDIASISVALRTLRELASQSAQH